MVTISQIAKRAKLSTAAVSKALNNKSDISEATRRQVQRIAESMGYSINPAARTLATNKTMTIGVIVTFPNIPTVTERMRGIQIAVREHGYLVTFAFHDGTAKSEQQEIDIMNGRIDGLVLTPTTQSTAMVASLDKLNVPVVLMSERQPDLTTDFVGCDDQEGGGQAAQHLLEKGCKHLSYFGAGSRIPSDLAILQGMREAVASQGESITDENICWGNIDQNKTAQNLNLLLNQSPRIDGVLCFSDLTALWVLQECKKQQIAVPEDLAIVGYDDNELAQLGSIPLSSVAQPNYEIGYQAGTLLLELLKSSEKAVPKQIVFPPKLMIRASSDRK